MYLLEVIWLTVEASGHVEGERHGEEEGCKERGRKDLIAAEDLQVSAKGNKEKGRQGDGALPSSQAMLRNHFSHIIPLQCKHVFNSCPFSNEIHY